MTNLDEVSNYVSQDGTLTKFSADADITGHLTVNNGLGADAVSTDYLTAISCNSTTSSTETGSATVSYSAPKVVVDQIVFNPSSQSEPVS